MSHIRRRDAGTSFDAFLQELETDAQAEGPGAVADLEASCLRFSPARVGRRSLDTAAARTR